MSFGGGGSDTTTTRVDVPAWYQQAQQNNISRATQLAHRPYELYGGPRIADWTGDQQTAFGQVRQQVGQSGAAFNEAQSYMRQSGTPLTPPGTAPAPVQPTYGAHNGQLPPGLSGPSAMPAGLDAPGGGGEWATGGGYPQTQHPGLEPPIPNETPGPEWGGGGDWQTGGPDPMTPHPGLPGEPPISGPGLPPEQGAPSNPWEYATAMMNPAQLGQAQGYNMTGAYADLGSNMMGNYDNPYQTQVIDRAMSDIDRAETKDLSQARRRAAGNSAFGGSRTAILEGEIGRNYNDMRGDVISNLRQQGYDTNLRAGMADADRRTGTSQYNAGLSTEANRYAAEMGNQFALQNAGFRQDASGRNADAVNLARRFGMETFLGAEGMNRDNAFRAGEGMAGLEGMRRGANIQDTERLFQIGEMERGLRQRGMDLARSDFEAQRRHDIEGLQLMIGALSGVPQGMFGTTTTAPGQNNSGGILGGIGSLLSGAGAIGSAGGIGSILPFFSDRRLKQDVVPLGDGLYEFAYVWDENTRHVGVMSDEVDTRYVVTGMSGFDMVDYALMEMEAA